MAEEDREEDPRPWSTALHPRPSPPREGCSGCSMPHMHKDRLLTRQVIFLTIIDQIGNCRHFQAMLDRKVLKIRSTGHGAIGVHNLTNHRSRIETCQTRQVHRPLGLSWSLQNATRTRPQGEYMPGASEIFRAT